MGCRRLFVIAALVMLIAAAAAANKTPRFGIPRFHADFGVDEENARFDSCLRCYGNPNSGRAPFALRTEAAIHLGNTKSCIAGYGGGGGGDPYQFCIPSWVAFFTHQGDVDVEEEATISPLVGEAARHHESIPSWTAISGFKRLIHRRMHDPVVEKEMEIVPYNFTRGLLGWASIQLLGESGGQEVSPGHLAGILISELKHMAEAHLGRQIYSALITVPRHLTSDGRRDVRSAATWQAGFGVAKLVEEPIAAAAAHGHRMKQADGKVVLVFHVGGRTSHATIFKFFDGRARLIKARDDFFLGGDDFTARLVDHFVELIKEKHGIDIRHDKVALLRLKAECERAKKALSEQQETTVSLVDGVDSLLTRAKLEELNRDLFQRVMALLDQVVMQAPVLDEQRGGILDAAMEMFTGRSRAAETRKDMIHEIVVVGGSTRILKIRQLVKNYFGGRDLNNRGVEPDEAVIHGALLLTRPPPVAPDIHLTARLPLSNATTISDPRILDSSNPVFQYI